MYKPTNIMPVETIASTCSEIQAFIEAHYNADNPNAVVERANGLESYMALSGKMLADAKYWYNDLLSSVFIEAIKEGNKAKMGTSTLNKYVDSICKDYQYVVDWTDRINRTCTHQLEFSRTIISKLKQEMYQSQRSTNS